ncbi:MAG: low affinity iron permease family protein [Labedaea sp.]
MISRWAQGATSWAGSGWASVLVVVVVVAWLAAGVMLGFSEQWHRWLHTGAALVTLVMVFVIQHTANQESRATLVKLDELLRAHEGARSNIMAVEKADLETLERVDREMDEHPHSAPNR